jgi:exodeoxyribonuclease VII small subunit
MPEPRTHTHAPKPADAPDASLTYEAALEELETIIEQIESGDIGLEQSIRRYERGAALLKHCRSILDQAEQRITELDARSITTEDGATPDDEGDA